MAQIFDDIKLPRDLVAIIPLEDPEERELRGRDSLLHIPDADDPELPTDMKLEIPSEHKNRPDQGIVRNVGPEVDPMIYVGAHVFFPGYAGDEINIENVGRLILIPSNGISFILEGYGEEYCLIDRARVLDQISRVQSEMEQEGERVSSEVQKFIEKLSARLERFDTHYMRQ